MEAAVFRIKTIYRNYRRARFIEFEPHRFLPAPFFFPEVATRNAL